MAMSNKKHEIADETYTRREALAALAKYSAVVGGSAATIVSADGLVSAASAYWSDEKWAKFCGQNPWHKKCVGYSGESDERIDF